MAQESHYTREDPGCLLPIACSGNSQKAKRCVLRECHKGRLLASSGLQRREGTPQLCGMHARNGDVATIDKTVHRRARSLAGEDKGGLRRRA